MTKSLKYVEIVKTFLPYSYNLEYKCILKEAQQMAQQFHLPMDTPLTAESFLTLQAKIIDQVIKTILDKGSDEISKKEIDALNPLKSSRDQIINDKDSILATLENKGLSDRNAVLALSKDDVDILKILSCCPQIKTIGGFIVALQCVASQ